MYIPGRGYVHFIKPERVTVRLDASWVCVSTPSRTRSHITFDSSRHVYIYCCCTRYALVCTVVVLTLSVTNPVAPVEWQVILVPAIGQFREFESPRVHTRINS